MKIKCAMLDAEDFDLTYGKVYEVEKVLGGMYKIKDDVGESSYMKEGEFEVVKEESTEWSGKGLPPVGSYVEYSGKDWEVCGINNGEIWLRTLDQFKVNVVFNIGSSVFKPIKSEKQKEIEEFTIHIDDFENGFSISETLAEYLYNQGYRKTK